VVNREAIRFRPDVQKNAMSVGFVNVKNALLGEAFDGASAGAVCEGEAPYKNPGLEKCLSGSPVVHPQSCFQ